MKIMRPLRILFSLFFVVSILAGPGVAYGQTDAAMGKEQRRIAREQRIARRANAATQRSLKEGKHPSYNSLLRSTNYEEMYREGLRYYNLTKRGKDYNSRRNYVKAQSLLDGAFQSQRFSGTPQQDSLTYYLGASFYKTGDFDVSEQVFDMFRRTFPSSVFLEDVEYMYAMGFYFASPDPEHDQTLTLQAIAAIAEYVGRYPNSVKAEECAARTTELYKKLYTKSYQNAKLYYTIRQYKAAVRALNNAIDEYPLTPYREELMYLATRSAWLFARNSVDSQQTDRYLAMMDNYYNLISEYTETEHLREVEQMRDEAQEHIAAHTRQEEGE